MGIAAAVAPLSMNSRGDRNCVAAGRSAVIFCSNTAPEGSSTTRTQIEPSFGGAAQNSVSTPPVAMANGVVGGLYKPMIVFSFQIAAQQTHAEAVLHSQTEGVE